MTKPAEQFARLTARLGYEFRDPRLLRTALTHPSAMHDHPSLREHNQRLEFLGDSVLELILSRALFDRLPKVDEGPLTKTRAGLVNRRTLAVHARTLALGEHLILSRSEELNGGRQRLSSLADAFEAVVGAVFLDGGFPAAERLVLECFADELANVDPSAGIENPKGELQELLQATSALPPDYMLLAATGPDHDRIFECTVHHGGRELARGTGRSKKAAEAEAALAALQRLRSGEIPLEPPLQAPSTAFPESGAAED